MIKTRVRPAYEMIEELTKENGGVPPILDGFNVPLTKENWDRIQLIIKRKFDVYVESKKRKKGFN